MKKITSKERNGQNHYHLTYNWNMSALTTLEGFIAKSRVHKAFTIIMHPLQVTQTMSLLEVKPKQMFYIGCDQLTPSMAIILFVHALHFGRVVIG